MPPIRWNNHGQPIAGVPDYFKDMIADQTLTMSSHLGASIPAFGVGNGFGSAVNVGSNQWSIRTLGEGDLNAVSEWEYISHLATGSVAGVVGRMPLNLDYYWIRLYENNEIRLTESNGGTTNLDTQALGQNLVQNEIFRLEHKITDSLGLQIHLGTFRGQGRADNSPGAASYNLSGIDGGADTFLTVSVDGASAETITLTSGDFGNYAACTPAEVAAVINTNLTGGRSWAVGNIIYVATETFGSTGSVNVTGGNANTVLSITTGAQTGDLQTVTANDNSLGTAGFCGFKMGFNADSAVWLRSYRVTYL
jgi:hypothetical protein